MACDPLTDEQREIRDLVRTLARERDRAARGGDRQVGASSRGTSSSCSASTRSSGSCSTRSTAASATGALMTLVAIEEVSKVCATSGLILAVQELGSLGIKLAGTRRAEAAVPAEARVRRVARRVRADGAGLGLGLGGDAHRGAARRRRVRPQRRQAVHHERRASPALHGVREDRPRGRPLGHLGVRRRGGHARLRGRRGSSRRWASRARRPARSSSTTAHPGRQPARRGGRGLQDRDAHPRPLAAGDRARRGSGSRRARPTTRSSTRRRARRWASRSPSTS